VTTQFCFEIHLEMEFQSQIKKYSIGADELLSAVTFCPYESACNLIAIASTTSLSIFSVNLNVLSKGNQTTEVSENLACFNHVGEYVEKCLFFYCCL